MIPSTTKTSRVSPQRRLPLLISTIVVAVVWNRRTPSATPRQRRIPLAEHPTLLSASMASRVSTTASILSSIVFIPLPIQRKAPSENSSKLLRLLTKASAATAVILSNRLPPDLPPLPIRRRSVITQPPQPQLPRDRRRHLTQL